MSLLRFSLHLAFTSKILFPLFFLCSWLSCPVRLSSIFVVSNTRNKAPHQFTWHAMIIDVRLASYIFLSLVFLGFLGLDGLQKVNRTFSLTGSASILIYWNKKSIYMHEKLKSSTARGVSRYTNMAAVTSCENALLRPYHFDQHKCNLVQLVNKKQRKRNYFHLRCFSSFYRQYNT